MIRINLLLVREVKRRLELRRQLLLTGVLVVLVLVYCGYSYMGLIGERRARQDELQQIKAELVGLEKILKEVKAFEKRTGKLKRQLAAIQAIKTNQGLPALYLDEISNRLPEQVWLVELQHTGKSMRIRGRSLNGLAGVAQFRKNIGRSRLFGTAKKGTSKRERIQKREVTAFAITVPMAKRKKPDEDTP